MKNSYDIWLSYVMGANCVNGQQIASCGYGPRLLYNLRHDLVSLNIFTERQIELAAHTSLEDVKNIIELHHKNEIKSINYTDKEYPDKFKNLPHAPLVLFYKGDISLLDAPFTVGVVGSRRCTREGEKACRIITEDVVKGGAVVISGLAQGVDSTAHKTCVGAGGKTVAVLGVPLDEYFPQTNRRFQDQLCEEHLVISEYYCTHLYHGANFIFRNRLIAGACDALCLIQAKERSGSIATVNRAIEYDKPVFTVPGSIFSPAYSGSNKLLVDGYAYAITNGRQLLDFMGVKVPEEKEETVVDYSSLDENSIAVLKAMDGTMNANTIIRACGLKAQLVKAVLTSLEMDGWVSRTDTGEYIRTK